MKARDATILVLPGLGGGDPQIWYHRWLPNLSTAHRVDQTDFSKPNRAAWVDNAVRASREHGDRPIILIGHSAGAITAVHAAAALPPGRLAGTFLVAPPDLELCAKYHPEIAALGPVPLERLNCPALLIASRNDPYCEFATAERYARFWDARLADAGNSGHLNADSGHGPWPEGSLSFARFVAGLNPSTTLQ